MGDLLLNTRVSVTKRNLERVEHLPEVLGTRDDRVEKFLALPEQLQASVKDLSREVLKLKNLELENELPQEVLDSLGALEDGLTDVRRQLSAMTREAGQLRAENSALAGRRDLDVFLRNAAEELKRTVTADNYWAQRERCERVFNEYVDLLRGVALRSMSIDRINDLFVLADALPELWGPLGDWTWQSLAVPSLMERNESTLASVLRIGFPEWTMWALPLLQHEFGHVVIGKHKADLTVAGPADAAILADALAVLVTGPAYACAALLLRLDPAHVEEASLDTLRSAEILAALERCAEADPNLTLLARRLDAEWSDALGSIGRDPQLVAAAKASPAVTGALEIAAEFLRLDPKAPRPRWATSWPAVVKLADELAAGDAATPNGERRSALASLLNAAWLARVPAVPGAEPDAAGLDRIAQTTVARMLELVKPAGGEPSVRSSRS